jgi:signal transduction histidine kinase
MSRSAELSETDAADHVRGALDRADAAAEPVDVTTDLPGAAPVTTDAEALRVVVESAVENAVAYADSEVRVGVDDHGEELVVTVDDDGPGIPDGELASIESGTETDLRHGRGLGLWQIKWGVDKLNGQLSFDTDGGTTVRIVVPDRPRRATAT